MEQLGGHEPIVDHDVGFAQPAERLERHQLGVARPGADERDARAWTQGASALRSRRGMNVSATSVAHATSLNGPARAARRTRSAPTMSRAAWRAPEMFRAAGPSHSSASQPVTKQPGEISNVGSISGRP